MTTQAAEAPMETEACEFEIRGNLAAINPLKIPKQARSAETLNLIADSMREVLKTKSRDSFEMSDLTTEVAKHDLSVGTLYRYFVGKHPTKSTREQLLDFVWESRGDNDYVASMEKAQRKLDKQARKAEKKATKKALREQASLETPS